LTYINNFLSEAYEKVFEKKPFNFFNEYYVITTGREELYDDVHLPWIDKVLFNYRKYQSCNYENHDSEALSMMDTLEDLVKAIGDKEEYK